MCGNDDLMTIYWCEVKVWSNHEVLMWGNEVFVWVNHEVLMWCNDDDVMMCDNDELLMLDNDDIVMWGNSEVWCRVMKYRCEVMTWPMDVGYDSLLMLKLLHKMCLRKMWGK